MEELNVLDVVDGVDPLAIAVIGMAGCFPGARDIAAFWQNLCTGLESIAFFSDEELMASGIPTAVWQDPNYVRASGVLSDIDLFDAFFFGYSPSEAAMMDPQHRLFMEHAWQALENAGYDPETCQGLIGVYAGASMNTYLYHNLRASHSQLEAGSGYQVMIASDKDFLATKTSYKLNLKGPSVTVQTACSTSLVAVHLACQSLRNGECDMALAGGVSVRVPHRAGYLYQEGMILSPEGHCRAFDAGAQGTVMGSGVGIVVLKMLGDAMINGDHIHAIIKGSALNNDGSLKAGYTAPGLDAQAAVIAEAQGVAGVDAESVTYVETHGTGTVIGDPIEIAALTKAFRRTTDKTGFCAVGSVKTNIGHLDAAAGVAGLIKAVLALEHKQIPPSLNFEKPNPRIDFDNSPFYVSTRLTEWHTDGTPRRAGVSSFGIGGTNAHAVLEEAPAVAPSGLARPWQLLLLSAKTESALDAATINLVECLRQQSQVNLADVAYTLQVGRRTFNQRRMVVCRDVDDALAALETRGAKRVLSAPQEATDRPVVFMFSGQGAQYVNMGLELYQTEATFRETVDECCALLGPHLDLDLHQVLYPPESKEEEASQQLQQTAITQPTLFVIEYALAQLWMAWGVRPQAMIGHSIGEYVAACLASVFSLEDGLALVAERGRLMQSLPAGAMLAVPLPESGVLPRLSADLSLAVINGPTACVVSGEMEAVEAFQKKMAAEGVTCRLLRTSHAFHSPMMEPILAPFIERVKKVRLQPPQIPYVSNVSGTWTTDAEATDPGYWARHLRQTVRFAQGLGQFFKDPAQILLEVGPGRTLSTLALRHPDKAGEQTVLSSLRHPQDVQSDVAFVLTTLGRLWLAGAPVDWAGFYAQERRLRLPLPTYPFERQRYWIEPEAEAQAAVVKSAAVRKADMADWFYVPSWKRSVTPLRQLSEGVEQQHWLVFADACGLGERLAERLIQEDHDVSVVRVGAAFDKLDEGMYTVDPAREEDYAALLDDLLAQEKRPQKIVHLWSLTPNGQPPAGLAELDNAQNLSFYSLLFLAQAWGRHNADEALDWTVVSNNLQEVSGEETLHPEKATLLGPVRIIPHEYPHIRCRSVDLVLPQVDSDQTDGLVDQLLQEVSVGSDDSLVAYRGPHRWVQRFEPACLTQAAEVTPRLKEGGVYLITGGLGGMGLVLAQHLAETVRARLVLTDLTALPAVGEWDEWLATHDTQDKSSLKIQQVQALEVLGSEVLVVQADVSDVSQMQAVVNQALTRFGRIDGVIHAAGVPGGGMILRRTREMAERIMSPKVRGALVLGTVLKDVAPDFVFLCSSVNAIVGRVGQVDYVAANAFLDAFVHHNALADGTFVVSTNWETWQQVGMAAEAAQQWAATTTATEVAQPLLDRCLMADENGAVYLTQFSVSQHWALHEHGILGRPTLPGTTYLEMARAAFEHHVGQGEIEIRDAYFLTPLIVEGEAQKKVRTVLQKRGEGYDFLVVSETEAAEGGWQEHARGSIALAAASPPQSQTIGDIEGQCNEQTIMSPLDKTRLGSFDLQRQAIGRGFTSSGEPLTVPSLVITEEGSAAEARFMEFGPRWHSLQWVKLGAREGLAFFELPAEWAADVQAYQLHPALLDFATSFLRLFRSQGSYLPLSYKRLTMRGPLPQRLYSYARYASSGAAQGITLSFDITLLDEQGRVLVEIEEFAVIKVQDVDRLGAMAGPRTIPAILSGEGGSGRTPSINLLQTDLQEGLLPAEGVKVFRRILGSPLSRVIVSTRDLTARLKQAEARRLSLLTEAAAMAAAPRLKHPRPSLMTAYAAPRSETEQRLADIWQEVLGIEQVGVHDNFFDLGGDSLLITQIHTKFRQSFEQDMSIANLLQYPTIADLAEYLSQVQEEAKPTFEHVRERSDKQKEARQKRKEKMIQLRRKVGD